MEFSPAFCIEGINYALLISACISFIIAIPERLSPWTQIVSISSKRATSTNNSGSQHQDGTFTTAAFKMLFVEFDNDPSHDVDMAFTAVHGDLA